MLLDPSKTLPGAWQELTAHLQVSDNLQFLASYRKGNPPPSSRHADCLVAGLRGPWVLQADQINALLLLAEWNRQHQAGDEQETSVFQQAVETAQTMAAACLDKHDLLCAACLALGSAAGGLQPAEINQSAAIMMGAIHQAGSQLQAASLLPDLILGCTELLPHLQVCAGKWLLATLLSLWQGPAPGKQQQARCGGACLYSQPAGLWEACAEYRAAKDFWCRQEQACRHFFEQEAAFCSATPVAWMQQLDRVCRRQGLEQVYMTNMLWLVSLWSRTSQLQSQASISAKEQAMLGVTLLNATSFLQPAHMRLSLATTAVRAALAHVSSLPQAAGALLRCLPACATDKDTASVHASRTQFLLQMAAPCLPVAPEGMRDEQGVDLALFYLHSPQPSAAAAAHAFLNACLPCLCEKEQIATIYIQRALQAFPSVTSEEMMRQALATMLRALPASSLVPLLAFRRMADSLWRQHALAEEQGVGQALPAARALLAILADCLLLVSFEVLPDTIQLMTKILQDMPPGLYASACQQVHEAISASDDHARKTKLVKWYQSTVRYPEDSHSQLHAPH
ncbi:hypothetical protein WJX84_006135 [Apatococcus fuscideae]|uniref:Uncharacterized protein n=1 Tax=Apatococcus fuscideae TaxID=2026836 RepID=A0AAW1T5Z3_9CHLO